MGDVPVVPNAPLTSTKGIKPGDVLLVAVRLLDKRTREPFWWRRFVAVLDVDDRTLLTVLSLKPIVDIAKDLRTIQISTPDTVVTLVPQEQWPQGVSAMWMKYAAMGLIKLDQP